MSQIGTNHEQLQKMHVAFAREMSERQLESDQAERTFQTTKKKEDTLRAEVEATKQAENETSERIVNTHTDFLSPSPLFTAK